MQLNKDEIIRDGDDYFSVFCVMGSVVYVKKVFNVNSMSHHELEDVLKHYRKIEIIGDKNHVK